MCCPSVRCRRCMSAVRLAEAIYHRPWPLESCSRQRALCQPRRVELPPGTPLLTRVKTAPVTFVPAAHAWRAVFSCCAAACLQVWCSQAWKHTPTPEPRPSTCRKVALSPLTQQPLRSMQPCVMSCAIAVTSSTHASVLS